MNQSSATTGSMPSHGQHQQRRPVAPVGNTATAVFDNLVTKITPDLAMCGQAAKLSAIDQIAPRDYITVYYFFRLRDDSHIPQIYSHLETALAGTLNDIPQLLTSVRSSDRSREELELSYHSTRGATIRCRDYHTPKGRRQWPHGTFEDIERRDFPYSTIEKHLVLAPIERYDDGSYPGLAMQANFIPGGLILTSRLYHTVCDGTGNYLFYQTFAKHCAAASRGEMFSPSSSITSTERSTIVDPERDVHVKQFPNWRPVDDTGDQHFLSPVHYDVSKLPKVQYAIFFISEQHIEDLRETLTTTSYKPSSLEAVGAFLWMKVVQARDIDAKKYPESKLSITVDARKRMTSPAVAANYWGNLSEPNAVARMPTRSLLNPISAKTTKRSRSNRASHATSEFQGKFSEGARSGPGWHAQAHDRAAGEAAARNAQLRITEAARKAQGKLSAAAGHASANASMAIDASNENLTVASQRIRQALAAVDNTAVRRLVGLIQQMPKATSLTWNVDRWPGPDMLIVCINYHFYNHLDFGAELGHSSCFRFSVGDTEGKPDGRCLFMPPRAKDGKGIETALQYDLATLRKLEADEEFMQFFERRN